MCIHFLLASGNWRITEVGGQNTKYLVVKIWPIYRWLFARELLHCKYWFESSVLSQKLHIINTVPIKLCHPELAINCRSSRSKLIRIGVWQFKMCSQLNSKMKNIIYICNFLIHNCISLLCFSDENKIFYKRNLHLGRWLSTQQDSCAYIVWLTYIYFNFCFVIFQNDILLLFQNATAVGQSWFGCVSFQLKNLTPN